MQISRCIGWMFERCSNLKKLNLAGWDPPADCNMYQLFEATPKLTQPETMNEALLQNYRSYYHNS